MTALLQPTVNIQSDLVTGWIGRGVNQFSSDVKFIIKQPEEYYARMKYGKLIPVLHMNFALLQSLAQYNVNISWLQSKEGMFRELRIAVIESTQSWSGCASD
jgi:hypothetical protein